MTLHAGWSFIIAQASQYEIYLNCICFHSQSEVGLYPEDTNHGLCENVYFCVVVLCIVLPISVCDEMSEITQKQVRVFGNSRYLGNLHKMGNYTVHPNVLYIASVIIIRSSTIDTNILRIYIASIYYLNTCCPVNLNHIFTVHCERSYAKIFEATQRKCTEMHQLYLFE